MHGAVLWSRDVQYTAPGGVQGRCAGIFSACMLGVVICTRQCGVVWCCVVLWSGDMQRPACWDVHCTYSVVHVVRCREQCNFTACCAVVRLCSSACGGVPCAVSFTSCRVVVW